MDPSFGVHVASCHMLLPKCSIVFVSSSFDKFGKFHLLLKEIHFLFCTLRIFARVEKNENAQCD